MQTASEERIEAVIISGPRKGEFISIVNGEAEPQLSPAEEAMLDFVVEQAKRVAENMRDTRLEAEALLNDLREAGRKRNITTAAPVLLMPGS